MSAAEGTSRQTRITDSSLLPHFGLKLLDSGKILVERGKTNARDTLVCGELPLCDVVLTAIWNLGRFLVGDLFPVSWRVSSEQVAISFSFPDG